jgi:hypothetical protein
MGDDVGCLALHLVQEMIGLISGWVKPKRLLRLVFAALMNKSKD